MNLNSRISRRNVLLTGAAGALAGLAMPYVARAAGDPIKVGILQPFSGGLEVLGQQGFQGAEMALLEANEAGGVLGGRMFEIVKADDRTDPKTAVERTSELIRRDKVTAIIGPVTSANRDAMLPTIERYKTPLLYATDYEGGVCSPYVACYSALPAHWVNPLVPYAVENLGNGGGVHHGRLRGVAGPVLCQQGRAVRRELSRHEALPRPSARASVLCPRDRGSAALFPSVSLQQRLGCPMLHDTAQLDLMFQALADPARRGMVERLSRGPASVSQLAEPLAMSLSAVVQHLNVLEASGLVRTEKVGRVRTCQIEPKALRAAEHWINERRLAWERRLDRLGDFLAETE